MNRQHKPVRRHNDAGYPVLAEKLARKILSGEYTPGDKLSARAIAVEAGVGRRVAGCALDLLAVKGLLRVEARKGFYVSESVRTGNHSRIGIFIFGMSPLQSGRMLAEVNSEIQASGCEAVYGSDAEEMYTFHEWLANHPGLDGLLLDGYIADRMLKPLQKWRKPYLLMGIHDTDNRHPCEDADFAVRMTDRLTEIFRPFGGKRIATILGDASSGSDRALMTAVRTAALRVGSDPDPELFVHADGAGYACMEKMLKITRPDVLYTVGAFQIALARLLAKQPDLTPPYVIGPKARMPPGLGDICDLHPEPFRIESEIAVRSVRRLLDLIKIQRSHPSINTRK